MILSSGQKYTLMTYLSLAYETIVTLFGRVRSYDEARILNSLTDAVAPAIPVDFTVESVHFGPMTLVGHLFYTLADGLFPGQRIHFLMCDLGVATDATLTPAHFGNGTALLFDTNGDDATLEWGTDGNWWIVNTQKATLVP